MNLPDIAAVLPIGVALVLLLTVFALIALTVRKRAELAVAEAQARAAEDRFATVADATEGWLWECDAELRLSYVSHLPAGADPTEILGKRRDEFPGLVDDPALWRRHFEDLNARRPFDNFIFTRDVPALGRFTVRVSGRPI